MWTVPNLMTLARIILIVPLTALVMLGDPVSAWTAFALYVVACFTDFLDGYLARKWGQTSALGRTLDPIADKVLVAVLSVALIACGTVQGWHSVAIAAILAREFIVAGLRESLAGQLVIPVTLLAKWKTTIQMIALGVLLAAQAMPLYSNLLTFGEVLLWLAAVLSIWTGWGYVSKAAQALKT